MEIALLWIEPSKTHPQIPILDVATGQVTYDYSIGLMVDIDYYAGCDDPTANTCTVQVHGYGTCQSCEVDSTQQVTLIDCSNLGTSIFSSSGQQQLEFVHESIPEYDLQFFQLSDEWNGCDSATTGPSVTVSTFPSLVPVSDAPSFGPSSSISNFPTSIASVGPSHTYVPTYTGTYVSTAYATSSMISTLSLPGDVSQGDCFTVERVFQDTSADAGTGCRNGQVTYSYLSGVTSVVEITVDYFADCDDRTGDSCTITVSGDYGEGICSGCHVDSRNMVTLLDCTDVDPPVLATGQTQSVEFEHDVTPSYDLQFFGLEIGTSLCDELTSVPTSIVTYTPSQAYSLGPSMAVTGSSMVTDVVAGDPSVGDCYLVEREIQSTTPHPTTGCVVTELEYRYVNGDGAVYEVVHVDAAHDCVNTPDTCTISVEGKGECDGCLYSMGEVSLTDCSNIQPPVFPSGSQSAEFFYDGSPESPYDLKFLNLAYNEERCLNFVDTEIPSQEPNTSEPTAVPLTSVPSPTLVPISDAPSGIVRSVSVPAILDFTFYQGTTDTNPTPEDVAAILDQVELFYTDVLQGALPGVVESIQAILSTPGRRHLMSVDYSLHFDLIVSFFDGAGVLSEDELIEAMSNANYLDFVQSYAWTLQNSVFYDTEHVAFKDFLGSLSPSYTIPPISEAPSYTIPLISEAPSYTIPPISEAPSGFDEQGICDFPPELPIWGLIQPATPDPLAYMNLYHGDPSQGECYSVKAVETWNKMATDDEFYCCTNSGMVFSYYNGGTDIYGVDSGYEMESYETVEVVVTQDCGQRGLPPTCIINVENVGECSSCLVDESSGEVIMEDCSNLGAVFPPGPLSIAWYGFTEPGDDPGNNFFPLTYDEDHCNHPVFSGAGPSDAPSVEFSDAPSGVIEFGACEAPADHSLSAVGIPASPDISFHDHVQGDLNNGDCYTVKRAVHGMTQTSGADPETYCCSIFGRAYTYYNGGLGADGVETGFDEDIYYNVTVSVVEDCGNRDLPTECLVEVEGYGSCGCSYDDSSESVQLDGDCNSLGVFVHGRPEVSLTTNLNDDDEFFGLGYDPDRCMHPALNVVSDAPSYVPVSDYPSLVPASDAPSFVAVSDHPSPVPLSDAPSLVGTFLLPYSDVPSLIPMSHAPSSIERSVSVPGILEFSFYDGTVDTVPDFEEVAAILEQVELFYTSVLQGAFPAVIDSIEALFSSPSRRDLMSVDYSLHFDLLVSFFGESAVPTEEEMVAVMKNVNYEDFVQSYAWNTEVHGSSTIFLNTEEVAFVDVLSSLTPSHIIPLISEAPSYTVPPISEAPSGFDEQGICDFPPELPIWGLIQPATPDPLAYMNLYHGDPSQGECYSVKAVETWNKMATDDEFYCCTNSGMVFSYYNGGTDIYGVDSGYEMESYDTVEVVVTQDCGQRGLPPTCIINVENVGECSSCLVDESSGEVIMEDCSNLGAVFPPGPLSIAWYGFTEPGDDPSNNFFPLTYDEDHCNHPVFSGAGPSDAPSVEFSDAPSGVIEFGACEAPADHSLSAVGIPASPDISFHDHVQGDLNNGDCYTVKRAVHGMTQTSGADPETYCCSIFGRAYTYYNGGLGADGVETGFDEDIYYNVTVSVVEDCGNRDLPTECLVEVEGYGSCGCSYDDSSESVQLDGDCNSLGVFVHGHPEVSLTTNLNDDDEFFGLGYDPDRCMHPALNVVSDAPSYVPVSDYPSLVPASDSPHSSYTNAPSSVPLSESPHISFSSSPLSSVTNTPSSVPLSGSPIISVSGSPHSSYTNAPSSVPLSESPHSSFSASPLSSVTDTPSSVPLSGSPISSFSASPQSSSTNAPSSVPLSESPISSVSASPQSSSTNAPSSVPLSGSPVSAVTGSPSAVSRSFSVTDEPTTAPPTETTVPTPTPMPSTLTCYDVFSNGAVSEGKCHATDIYYCIESWEDGCTATTAYYDYYNQAGAEKTSYHYISVFSATGCDPVANPGQPSNDCSIDSFDASVHTCNSCVSSGDTITMTDCSNVADTFDPSADQVISFAQDEFFDVIQTDAMCSHSSVTSSSDAGSYASYGTEDEASDVTLPLEVTLHFTFFEGHGENPDDQSIQLLVVNTINFFTTILLADDAFKDELKDIVMLSIDPVYSSASPDEFTITVTADIVVRGTQASNASTEAAATALGNANMTSYLRHYVRHNPTNQRNQFYEARKIQFKAFGHKKEVTGTQVR
ncbi:expressed unknown protein [Seminavis robusta]|uniref:Uncharacterized protein n=1 Tax=Seminavis robusta TaxID=568900 RepID=A0A9N8H170_9STRA|nr:expressed unknown protein [Seminavis robusta]|eukprot:Sro34_g021960.1 n/a (2206) ;mRNA; r:65268-72035